MKYLLLVLIRLYWILIPKSSRKKCIFKNSCSHFVYKETNEKGLIDGIKALRFRFNNCRGGFEIFRNPINNEIQMLLPSKTIINCNEIAERLIIK